MSYRELPIITAGAISTVDTFADLAAITGAEVGEVRYVIDEEQLYAYSEGGSWETVGGGVIGPGSSTDNAVARWDGTGGNTLQNSNVTIDDTGNVSLPADPTLGGHAVRKSFADSTYLFVADGQGIEKSGLTFSLELDGGTLSKSSSGVKVADGGISNDQVGAAANIAFTKMANLTANRALLSNGSGYVAASTVTQTELEYLSGVTGAIQTQLNDKVDDSQVGAAGGVASLDGGGKVPVSQLPNSIMEYLGTWAASTNTPTLSNGTGNAGDVYVASDAGTVDFGAGNITFAAGDWVVYSGSVWQKSVNSNAVASVNGYTGAVTLVKGDIGLGNVDNTSDATKNSAVATLTNKTLTLPKINDASSDHQFTIVGAELIGSVNVTIPDPFADDTFVLRDMQQTLLQKTLDTPTIDGDLYIWDSNNSHTYRIRPLNITGNYTIDLPVITGADEFALLATAQTLTNKTINGSSNTLTVLAGTQLSGATPIANGGTGQISQTAAFDALAPTTTKGDLIVHNGTDNVRVAAGSNGQVLVADSVAASGVSWQSIESSGEINYITNNNGVFTLNQSQTDGVGDWVDSGTGTTSSIDTDSGDLPRFPLQTTGITITNDGSGTGHTRVRFRVPQADRNKKLKIEWAQYAGAGYETGDFTAALYNYSSNDYVTGEAPVSLHGSSSIPAQTGVYYNEFDADDREYYELRIVRAAGAAAEYITLNDVVVGPGKLHSGGVITSWATKTATVSGFGDSPSTKMTTRRVGDSLEVILSVLLEPTPSGNLVFTIPDSLTADTTKLGLSNNANLDTQDWYVPGQVLYLDRSPSPDQRFNGMAVINGTTTTQIYFIGAGYGDPGQSPWGTTNSLPVAPADTDAFHMHLMIPILEWSGSGVLNTIVQDNLTEWSAAYTPGEVGNWTTSARTAKYRRVGSDIEIAATAVVSTVSGSFFWQPSALLPTGLTINESAMEMSSVYDRQVVGDAVLADITGNQYGAAVDYDNSSNAFFVQGPNGQIASALTTPFTWASGDVIKINIRMPVTEWAGSQSSLVGFSQASTVQSGLVSREAYQELDISSTGSFSAGQPVLRVSRAGNLVTLSWNTLAHTSSSSPTSAAGFIPEFYRPAHAVNTVYALNSTTVRTLNISSAGTLTFDYRDWAGSSSAQTATIAGTMCWTVD